MGTSIAIICISTALLAWSWASYVSYKRVYEELADLNANLIVLRGRLAVLENLEQESRIKQRENLVKQRIPACWAATRMRQERCTVKTD